MTCPQCQGPITRSVRLDGLCPVCVSAEYLAEWVKQNNLAQGMERLRQRVKVDEKYRRKRK